LTTAWQLTTDDFAAPDVGTLWDLCLSSEYDRDRVVRGIAEWLGPPDDLKVLDAACGSGFPALDLHRMGYQLTCSDGSAFMLERFRHVAKAADIPIEPVQALWEELGELYAGSFDAVLCRGCSFIYAGTFEADVPPDWSALESSLRSFVRCLRPGGRLYLDCPKEEDMQDEDSGWMKHPPRTIDGHQIEIEERLFTDRTARQRRWMVQLRIDDASTEFERRSHYLPHAEFAGLLQDAGLEDVGRADVTGERYAVFVGRSPVTEPREPAPLSG
jgi:Methylase involved in ubiquinone/menaquinone biosynthesis